MGDFKFYEREETENTFVSDDSDIQEDETKEYDVHFWCKEKDIPVGFTFKSKKQDYIQA